MAESVVKAAVVYDVSQMKEGVASTIEGLQEMAEQANVTSTTMQSKSQAMAQAAQEASAKVTVADLEMAKSARAVTEAKAAQLRMSKDVKLGIVSEADGYVLMAKVIGDTAAAQARLGLAQKAVALELAAPALAAAAAEAAIVAAAEAEAAAAVKAAEAANLSSVSWAASFERIAMSARASLGEVQEKLVATAETAKLSSGSIAGGFSALSSLMGAGIAVGFAAHFIEEAATVDVELGHLSVQTGITAHALGGLQLMVKEMKGDWAAIETGLIKVEVAQSKAAGGSKPLTAAFHAIGISVAEVKSLNTEQMLERVAEGFKTHNNEAMRAQVALALFGKGGKALIPILVEQGAALDANIKKHADEAGVTDQSVEAARRYTAAMADLSAWAMKLAQNALPNLMQQMRMLKADVMAIGMVVVGVGEVIFRTFESIYRSAVPFAKLLYDIATMNFEGAKQDIKDYANAWTDSFKTGWGQVKEMWANTVAQYKQPIKLGPLEAEAPKDPLGGSIGGTGGGKGDKAAEARLRAMEEERNQLAQQGQLSAKADHDFWAARIDAFNAGSAEYKAIQEKITHDDVEGAKVAHEAIAKLKTSESKNTDGAGEAAVQHGLDGMNTLLREQAEDVLRTGTRWESYRAAVLKGKEQTIQFNEAAEEARIQMLETAGAISPMAAAQQMAAIHTSEHVERLRELQAELAKIKADGANMKPGDKGYEQNATKAQNAQNAVDQEVGAGKKQADQDTDKQNAAISAPYLKAFDQIKGGWLRVQGDLLAGNKHIGQDFARMALGLVQSAAASVEGILAKHARMYIEDEILSHSSEARKAAAKVTAAAAAKASQVTAAATGQAALAAVNIASVTSYAAVAAAGAAAAVAAIPIVGPALAAAAATSMFAGIEGTFGPLAAFEKGGVVGGSQGMAIPILAHAGERVLTPSQTTNFDSMVNNNSTGGGDSHFHFGNNYSGAASDVKAQAQQSDREFSLRIKRLHREGKLQIA